MLIKSWKKTTRVETIIERRKKEIYEETGWKKEQYKDIKLLKKCLERMITPKTAESLTNEIKEVMEKNGLTDNTTCLTTVLVYLFEVLTL